MRPDDRAASASAGAPSVRAAARANAAAPFAAPFHHGAPLGSPSVILRSSEAGGRSEVDARIAMERGVARIILATTTRMGSKLTPLDRITIEALGATGEARRVDLAAARTGARGSMLTDEDVRDIIAGRACSCVRVRRHAVVGALHSGHAYRPACQQISSAISKPREIIGTSISVRAGDRRTPYARWSHRRNPRGRGRGRETLPSLPRRTRTSRTAASTTSATRISPSGCAGAAKKIRAMQSRTALASAFLIPRLISDRTKTVSS